MDVLPTITRAPVTRPVPGVVARATGNRAYCVLVLSTDPRERGMAMSLVERARALWETRAILYLLIVRDLKVRYAGSVLGYMWTILDPLMMTGVYWFIFSVVVGSARTPTSCSSSWACSRGSGSPPASPAAPRPWARRRGWCAPPGCPARSGCSRWSAP